MRSKEPKILKQRAVKLSVKDCVQLSVTLVPGTEEFRAYNRIKRKYLTEMNDRQQYASDDELCVSDLGNSELVRGSLLAFADVPQKELPDYIDAARKPKGRPSLGIGAESSDGQADSEANLNKQAPLLH